MAYLEMPEAMKTKLELLIQNWNGLWMRLKQGKHQLTLKEENESFLKFINATTPLINIR